MTLAEVLVALALMSSLILLWRPVVTGVRTLPDQNEELKMLQAESELSAYMSKSAKFSGVGRSLLPYTVSPPGSEAFTTYNLEVRHTASGHYLQGSQTEAAGMTPLLYGVHTIRFTAISPGRVRFELTMISGARLTGVLYDKTKR